MSRTLHSIFLSSLICLFFAGGTALSAQAPSFRAETLRGESLELRNLIKPKRGVLVAFWASWCTPCIEELKHVQEHLRKHPEFPMEVVTVNVDTSETSTDVIPTLRMYGFEFPVVLDPKHEIFNRYHTSKTLPFSVLVGPSGEIEKTFNGFQNHMFRDIDEALKISTQSGEPNASS